MNRAGGRAGSGARHPGARLTGGSAAGRRLATSAIEGMRPSLGLLRAALFNMLGPGIAGTAVVDLCAGSGSLGLEALSRDAAFVTFVELRRQCVELIRGNLGTLQWNDRAEIVTADALSWLRTHPDQLCGAGLVLLDPPYRPPGPDLLAGLMRELGRRAELVPRWDPLVAAEHHRNLALPEEVGALHCVRARRYGTSTLSLYRRAA